MPKEYNFISAVVYVHNNVAELPAFITMLGNYLSTTFEKYEIVVVDDASTDNSIKALMETVPADRKNAIQVIKMGFYQGLELCMEAGIEFAVGDFVYEFDSPIANYSEDNLKEVYNKCLEGFDIVVGCSNKTTHHLSKIYYWLYNRYSTTPVKLRTESFRLLSRRAVNRVKNMTKTVLYRKAIYASCGLPLYHYEFAQIGETPVQKIGSDEFFSSLNIANDALMLYTNFGYRFALNVSIALIIALSLVAMYAVIIYLAGHPVEGWTTTVLFMIFGFLGISVLLTILIKYVSLILRSVFTRNRYIVQSVEKLR